MNDFVDGYCERLVPGFWDEPLNAVTNLSFIVAAVLIARLAGKDGTLARPSLLIPLLLLIATGIGSFLFHTLANSWSGAADTLALGFCLLATIYFAARRFLGMGWLTAFVWPAAMIGGAFLFGRFAPVPGAFYLGPFAAGIAISALLLVRGHPAGRWIGAAVLVFVPSFIFRTLDGPLCEDWAFGTHFLWHILNGVVLGLAIRPLAWGDEGGRTDGAGRAA
ncbi:MAG: hypothetical protein ACMVY4_19005 [Minwuia sp.]|uniref:hypothetical protein n=1 Tax=Minwuia sp. TaxID=2493630 RepID=UPI003A8B7361